jgi:malate dehydrogenase (quinone)
MNEEERQSGIYDVAILGGGVSGTGLLYALAKYSDIGRLALLEKETALGQVNSQARNNSQTLHVGDIETNYSVEKVRQVKPAAMMTVRYVDSLPADRARGILFPVKKMVLAVGRQECALLARRYEDLRPIFPALKKIGRDEIAKLEPALVDGRDPREEILALANDEGYAVDFGLLAESFAREAVIAAEARTVDVLLGRTVKRIVRREDGLFALDTAKGAIVARAVVVDADAHSLTFAKAMGYGREYSLIPIAGSFYFSAPKLNGKVYTVQEPKLPFAAVHGDPDIIAGGQTRWGPTARFFPVLESRRWRTVFEYVRTSGLGRPSAWLSFFSILLEPVRFFYLVRNACYELPWIGIRLFSKSVRKIVPTVKVSDLRRADGFGGMRLQRVDVRTRELQLGEGKIVGDRILFNMTPSPGASVALYNGMRDAEFVTGALDGRFVFDEKRMRHDLFDDAQSPLPDTSVRDSYAS